MLNLTQLVCGYHGAFKTRPISLQIAEGQTIGIIGPNGSGKTTFLKTILGVASAIEGNFEWRQKYRFGYLPQASQLNTILPITVDEVLMAATKHPRMTLQDLNDPFSVSGLVEHNFQKLSGGQKQRVLMTRTFLTKPEILFLDEPNNHVDAKTQQAFWEFLKTQSQVKGIFVIDHNIANLKAAVGQVIQFEES